jgi:hypothetical protein
VNDPGISVGWSIPGSFTSRARCVAGAVLGILRGGELVRPSSHPSRMDRRDCWPEPGDGYNGQQELFTPSGSGRRRSRSVCELVPSSTRTCWRPTQVAQRPSTSPLPSRVSRWRKGTWSHPCSSLWKTERNDARANRRPRRAVYPDGRGHDGGERRRSSAGIRGA